MDVCELSGGPIVWCLVGANNGRTKKPPRNRKFLPPVVWVLPGGRCVLGRGKAQGRFVACNEHVHPLSLTSTLAPVIYDQRRMLYTLIARIRWPASNPIVLFEREIWKTREHATRPTAAHPNLFVGSSDSTAAVSG